MSDIHTSAAEADYLLNRPFTMPSDDGGIWAIAFTTRTGTLLTAVFAVVLLIIFALLWTFICFLAVLLGGDFRTGEVTESRYGAMVTLWNSDDPLLAGKRMMRYSYHSLIPEHDKAEDSKSHGGTTARQQVHGAATTGKKHNKWGDFTYGVIVAIVAVCIYIGSIVTGIIGPLYLQIGNVAPVRPTSVFYPKDPGQEDAQANLQNFGLLAPGALRAIGSVESASEEVRAQVLIDDGPLDKTPDGLSMWLSYKYKVSGVDFGLQHASKLEVAVSGYCYTEYSWWREDKNDTERYRLWPEFPMEPPLDRLISHSPSNIQLAPRAAFLVHPDALNQMAGNSSVSYAVLVASAHRASINVGTDPWYTTEPRDTAYPPAPWDAAFWMKTKRPILACNQQDKWSYDGHEAQSVSEVDSLPGLDLPEALRDILLNAFSTPMVVRLGNAIGDSALRSRTTSPQGVIDAQKSSIRNDMERLIVAAYLASANVFSDTTKFSGQETYPNVLRGEDGQPAEGAGDIVVNGAGIQTFSMVGLVVLATILVFLMLQAWLISWLVHSHSSHYAAGPSDRNVTVDGRKKRKSVWARFSALEALNLFNDAFDAGDRKCETPDMTRTVSFVKCGAKSCPGHAVVGTGFQAGDPEACGSPEAAVGNGPQPLIGQKGLDKESK
ncbi:hypothetical protein B0H66DRAFT_526531 [Apodospora peruviana]|uniref:Uncharacterized protein n=1 Tax=Apodospora peruviana TaxID=516989 RepID=A0AAE0IQ56_9PEZI|nr:hypothetical protein B0H66DRAFT_526531 [Apodospora peruviana]